MQVKLTVNEYHHAANAGFIRQFNNVVKDVKPAQGGANAAEGFDKHIIGTLGEYAFAKAYNLNWRGPGEVGAKDVAGYQVRCTQYDDGSLLVRPRDKDDEVFVLVRGFGLNYTIVGFLTGAEAKSKGVLKGAPGNSYWQVDPRHLKPMSELFPGETRAAS